MREDRPESWRSSVCRWEDQGVVARTFRISVNGVLAGLFLGGVRAAYIRLSVP
jgi:hypothetical protein